MTEPDFVHTPLSRVGAMIDWLLGPSSTSTIQGPAKTRTLTIQSEGSGVWPRATLSCQRLVYKTQYKRWWVPTEHRTLYVVSMSVPDEVIERHGAEAFASVTYPLLCNYFLQWTTYPHVCAILAYLDDLLCRLGGSMPTERSIVL